MTTAKHTTDDPAPVHPLDGHVCEWPDYRGAPIREGDTLVHPSGETGKVLFYPNAKDKYDRWMVFYPGDGFSSRLCLQIGDKGRAVVLRSPIVTDHRGGASGASTCWAG